MNEFHKLVDESIEKVLLEAGKDVYGIRTKKGLVTTSDIKYDAEGNPIPQKPSEEFKKEMLRDVVKSGDLEDIPYSLQATKPEESTPWSKEKPSGIHKIYSTEVPEPSVGIERKNILNAMLENSNKWLETKDIEDAWDEFRKEARTKTIGISSPTNADKEIIWNLFYDTIMNKIKPLRNDDKKVYDYLKSLKGKGLDKEILRPANRRIWAMVEGRKRWMQGLRNKLHSLKNDVINYVYPSITESAEYGSDLNLANYSKALSDAYARANYELPITIDGEETSITINLIKNYDTIKRLTPGFSNDNLDNSLLKQIMSADIKIFNSIGNVLQDIENKTIVKRLGWKFERDGLKSAISTMDGSAPEIFREQFVSLIEKLPYFGESREEANRIYNLLIHGKSGGDISAEFEKSAEQQPEKSPTLYPTMHQKSRPLSPKELTAEFPAHGEAEKIDRENIRDILKLIKLAVDTYSKTKYESYEGTGKLAAAGLLPKDPSRKRLGIGSTSGFNQVLNKIIADLGTNASIGELKTALFRDSNEKLIPNMSVVLMRNLKEIKKELIDPWIDSSDLSQISPTDNAQSDADYIRNASLPESYSRYFHSGKDPIAIAYKNLISSEEGIKDEEELEPEVSDELKNKAKNLSSLFLELVKHESKDHFEIANQLKDMLVNQMSKLFGAASGPVFSEMVRNFSSMEIKNSDKNRLFGRIIDLISEINDEIDPELAKKLVFASISNNDWQVLDLLVGINKNIRAEPGTQPKSIDWYENSVEGLIKAAATVGDADTISWAIDYVKNLPNPPIMSLRDLAFKKSDNYVQAYRAMKKFGISDKMSIVYALPKTSGPQHTREVYSKLLYDIIKSYGQDAYKEAEIKILQAKKQNPKIKSSPAAIATKAIKDSVIKGGEETIQILNPKSYSPDSPQYMAIIKELVSNPQPKTLSVYDHIQKFEEFKDIPDMWKADASLDAPAMVNKLQQELSALIKELAGNILIDMQKAKTKGDKSGDLIYKLPSQIKSLLKNYGLGEEEINSIITHNTVVPVKKKPRDNKERIAKDLVSAYIRLEEWKAKAKDQAGPIEEPIEPEDLPKRKLSDISYGVPERPRVSSVGERMDIDRAKKKEKELKTEIENLEISLKTATDLTMKEKQKQLEVISNKREELQHVRSQIRTEIARRSSQKASQATEIERLIEVMPERENEIRRLAKAGHSYGDIIELVS